MSGGGGREWWRGGEGVVALGARRCLRMVVLGARSCVRAVVLGPRLLASCCHPRASVRRLLGSEGWGASGGGGRAWWCSSLVTIHVCMLGHCRRSRMLGPRRRSRMLVLGPCPFVVCRVRLRSLVVCGCVAGRLWLQVSSRRRCPCLRIVSCHIIIFSCCGWC